MKSKNIFKKNFTKFFKNELVRGGLYLTIMMNIFNAIGFLFQFISARVLGPADYGILTTIMALIYILAIPSDSIQTIISRFSTKYSTKKDYPRLKNLMFSGIRKFLFLGFLGFLLMALLSGVIGSFLDINFIFIILLGVMAIGMLIIPVLRGILQGTKKFNYLGFSFIIEGTIKLLLVIILFLFGLRIFSPVFSIILSVFVAFVFIFTFSPIKKIIFSKRIKEKVTGIYSYSFPVLLALTCITIFYTIDLLLAKRFFGGEIAGLYGAIAILSKIIFFFSVPISRALFPIVSEKNDNKISTKSIVWKTLSFMFGLGILALLAYLIFPKLIIYILYGSQYIGFSTYLIYPTIAMVFLSLTNIIIFSNLSNPKDKSVYFLPIFVIIQLVLLFLFHNTLMQFISMLILGNSITFLYFLINLIKNEK